MERIDQQFEFLREIDKEKFIGRQTYLTDGKRKENDAEHAWHMAIMTILLGEYANEEIDVLKTVTMLLIHDIVEIDAIRALADAGQIVIACGGGGIPVMEQGYNLRGASAIIEKDLATGLLAKEIDADVMMILTSVDNVTLNYGTKDEQPIKRMSIDQAKDYISQGQFEFASMLPKVSASIDFLESGKGRKAIITTLDKAKDSLKGHAGTVIE